MSKIVGFWSKYRESDQFKRDSGVLWLLLLLLGLLLTIYCVK